MMALIGNLTASSLPFSAIALRTSAPQAGAWHPFKWLLEQGLIDLKAPLAEPQESDGEEDGDEEVEVCSICVSAMPNPVLRCRLECGHQLCRRCARELFSFNSDADGQAPSRWPCPMCREEVRGAL